MYLAFAQAESNDWQPLEQCIQRLKNFEREVTESVAIKTLIPLDRRLSYMIDGIRYAELNSEKLKSFVGSNKSDKLAPYLVSNAVVACEAEETKLSSYLGGLKRFLIFFFVTTVSVALYGAYLFSALVRAPAIEDKVLKQRPRKDVG